jgi:hypothetical protein
LKCIAPVLNTTTHVASIDSVIAVNVKNSTICVRVIFVHHGASDTGSAAMRGERLLGSELAFMDAMSVSPNGEEMAVAGPAAPNGDAARAAGLLLPPICTGRGFCGESPPACDSNVNRRGSFDGAEAAMAMRQFDCLFGTGA